MIEQPTTEAAPRPNRLKRLVAFLLASRRRTILLASALVLLLLSGLVLYLVLSCPPVDQLVDANPSTTALIEHRKKQGQVPRNLPSLQSTFVPLKQIPDLLQKTVIAAEDSAFYGHEGIDWFEVKEAFKKNWKEGRVVRGASTITQQLAKNLFLSEERSFFRKFREWILASKLEGALSKRRILELYFNCIEFGPGLFGIGPAARAYFGKAPSELSLDEMVRLSAVIPAPRGMNPTLASPRLEKASRMILERLRRFRYITDDGFAQADLNLAAFFQGASPAASPDGGSGSTEEEPEQPSTTETEEKK